MTVDLTQLVLPEARAEKARAALRLAVKQARDQAIGRIGLPAVREFRRRSLRAEHESRLAALGDMETTTPELNAVAMVRIDATASTDRGGLA